MPNQVIEKKGGLRRHLIRGASGSLIIKVASIGLAFVVAVVLARLLGTRGLGIYAFSISTVNLLSVVARLGLPSLIVREMAVYKSRGAFQLMHGLIIRAWEGLFASSLLLAIIAGTLGFFLAGKIDALDLRVFYLALILILLDSLTQLHGSALRGLHRILLGQLPQLLRPSFFLFCIGGLYFFMPRSLNPFNAMGVQLLAAFMTTVVVFIFFYKVLPSQVKQTTPEFQTKFWLTSAWPMLLSNAMQTLNKTTPIILLGILDGAKGVGIFRVAQRGADLVPFGLMAVNMVLAPTVSSLFASGEMDRLQRILTKSSRAILAFSLPVSLALMLGGPWLVPFVFGTKYQPAILPLILLCAGQLVNTAMGSVGMVLTMTQNERLTATGLSIAAITNVVLNIILIPFWGAVGAAMASSLSLVLWNILLTYWLYRRLGLTATAFGKV